MADLLFSEAALVALCYFVAATSVSRLMEVGATRSIVFAILNIAAVWLIFFGRTQSGVWAMSMYTLILLIFWIMLRISQKTSRYVFLLGFVPADPIARFCQDDWPTFLRRTFLYDVPLCPRGMGNE